MIPSDAHRRPDDTQPHRGLPQPTGRLRSRLTVGSAVMMGLSIMLMSQTQDLWQFVLFFGVIGDFGVPGLGYGVLSPTIAK